MKKKNSVKILLLVLTLLVFPIISQVSVSAAGNTAEAKAKTGWVSRPDGNYYYLNGRPISGGWHRVNGVNCYFEWNGRAESGWIKYNGRNYYLTAYGRPVTGWQKINGVSCWFDKWGHAGQGWFNYNGKRYYLNGYGRPLTGWQTIGGKRHYFNKWGHAIPGWIKYRGMRYYLNKDGRVHYGWQKIGNYRYYFDMKYGYAKTGWQTINGARCCFNSYGQALTGTRTIDGIRYTFSDYGRVISSVDPVVYRAVAIGESNYPGTSSDLSACAYDARAMATMCKKTGYTTANYYLNASYSKISSSISNTFAAANSNDVSLFYYTGHGSSGGSLVTTSNEYVSPYTLASWLKQVPGNVVVVLDSCYSGAAIGKNAVDPKEFNNNVIAAFDDAELEVKNSDAKSGPMSTSKFKVLTACGQYEYSYASSYSSRFTYYLVQGTGYDYSGNKLASIYADVNRDKKLSLKECYDYTYDNCISYPAQHVRCYPENSSFKLFQR